jgi:hypothetical protein
LRVRVSACLRVQVQFLSSRLLLGADVLGCMCARPTLQSLILMFVPACLRACTDLYSIDQTGSNYPPELYTPRVPAEDFYDGAVWLGILSVFVPSPLAPTVIAGLVRARSAGLIWSARDAPVPIARSQQLGLASLRVCRVFPFAALAARVRAQEERAAADRQRTGVIDFVQPHSQVRSFFLWLDFSWLAEQFPYIACDLARSLYAVCSLRRWAANRAECCPRQTSRRSKVRSISFEHRRIFLRLARCVASRVFAAKAMERAASIRDSLAARGNVAP